MAESTYHEQHQKDGSVRFLCDICDWWTPQMVNLQQHANQQHQGVLVAGEPTTEPDPEDGEDVPEPDEPPPIRPPTPPTPPEHPHGTPPGQDPDFVPPGHGGTPPGQDKPDEDEPVPTHPIAEPQAVREAVDRAYELVQEPQSVHPSAEPQAVGA